ncbi:hypothetical protein AXG93_3457s1380 [Marchantia polymorpha subsp. ruderalis]|uniref:DDE Tnp4 domain-containing protein n=1 Tax=Marchantia polymorpha subsp. ruderalis TaxID=1480154 RepID=A0A176W0Z1_MARPO|nr:hypothetical protein AXG93_3457s1380 [Marchantia polymorpha subsp. ruderalis]
MQGAALMGACAASTVALNVAMQQFAGAGGMGDTGNGSEDDDYPPSLLAANMNAQFLAVMCAGGITSEDLFGSTSPQLWYIKPRSTQWWDVFVSQPENEEPEKWKTLFRVSKPTFDYICGLVRADMETFKNPSNFSHIKGREITVEKQVAVALRRLSSGDPVSTVGELFGVGNATVSKVTWRFIKAIVERARHHLKWPEGEQMERVKASFEDLTGLPNCCGVVGLTHIRILFPPEESSVQWMDRVGNISMVSQAIVDTNMRFLDVCIGWPGANEDAEVLQNSTFYRLSESGERLNGPAKFIVGRTMPEYVLGGAGHPLLPWLITPYPQDFVTANNEYFTRTPLQAAYNARHESARVVVDNAFAYLKGVWRMLYKANRNPNTPKLSSLVFACCLLHNILLDRGEVIDEKLWLNGHHDEGYSALVAEQYGDSDGWQYRDMLTEFLALHNRL